MKVSKLISGFLLAGALWAPARTWTSADGSKSFEGELQNYDAAAGKVTVLVDGQQIIFTQDKLSEDDQTFLSEQKAEMEAKAEAAADMEAVKEQKVGSKLTKRVLRKLDGKKFKKAELEKSPEYYLLYFSASW